MSSAHLICIASLASALAAGLVLTPVVRELARRFGFVDKPDNARKTHKSAVALGGGVAVATATLTGVLVAAVASWLGHDRLLAGLSTGVQLALLLGSLLIVSLGLIDDAVAMRGRYKLLGQFVVSGLLISAGLKIESFHFFGQNVELGWFAAAFTMFWLLGSINAINLIDGIDGLASSVGLVLCLTLAAIIGITGLESRLADAVVLLSLAGALLGFLRYNFAPATIYLGDAGSMLVGLVIGVMAIPSNAKATAAIGLAIPVAVWSIPILDSAAAILRRKLTGRSVFAADRGHLHHSLLVRGWSVRQASLFIALICAITGISAVLSVQMQREWIALLTVAAVILFLIFTRTFGHIEFALVKDRFHRSAMALGGDARAARGRQSAIRLQGSRQWEALWAAIVESAEDYRLVKATLSINMPALHEVFYAQWEASDAPPEDDPRWTLAQPLIVDGAEVGSLEIAGTPGDPSRSTNAQIVQALEFFEPVEDDIRRIREQIRVEQSEVQTGRSGAFPSQADPPPDPEQSLAGQTPSGSSS